MTNARPRDVAPSRGELLDAALRCAMYRAFRYRGYETDEKALQALRRKCPKTSAVRRTNAFVKASEAHQELAKIVQHRPEKLIDATRPGRMNAGEIQRRLARLQARYPQFRKSTLDGAQGLAVYYYVLR